MDRELILIGDLERDVLELKLKEENLQKDIFKLTRSIHKDKKTLNNKIKARWIISEVTRLTQDKFKERVESLVTMAIQSVFDRPFEFKLLFEYKRNHFECHPIIMENGNEYEPEDEMGGGILDIISFAWRIILWSLESPRSRNVIILDEPFRFIGRYLDLAGKMLKEISHKLSIQIIMVTHDDELSQIADYAYKVSHNGIESLIRKI